MFYIIFHIFSNNDSLLYSFMFYLFYYDFIPLHVMFSCDVILCVNTRRRSWCSFTLLWGLQFDTNAFHIIFRVHVYQHIELFFNKVLYMYIKKMPHWIHSVSVSMMEVAPSAGWEGNHRLISTCPGLEMSTSQMLVKYEGGCLIFFTHQPKEQ